MMRSDVDFQKLKEGEQNISEYDYFSTNICPACVMCGTRSPFIQLGLYCISKTYGMMRILWTRETELPVGRVTS